MSTTNSTILTLRNARNKRVERMFFTVFGKCYNEKKTMRKRRIDVVKVNDTKIQNSSLK